MHDSHIIVVKLGGSLAGSRYLADWVGALASCGGQGVVVPGGGPFADAVRQAQANIGFSDAAAHHLALLAMEQFGWALASLNSNFRVVDSAVAIRSALRAGNVPIWSPVKMVLDCREISQSWDVTSDSLAAWLAGQLGAGRLVLVKHGAPFGDPLSAADLVARGIVDPEFPRFLASSGARACIVAAEASGSARKAISERGMPGTPIGLHDPYARRLLASLWPRSNSRAGDGH
jgi:5-(aminomethyl)-3-furanmethanol phosphate kinase